MARIQKTKKIYRKVERRGRSKMTGFVEVSQNEMLEVDGGVVVTTAFVGACVVWGFNAGLLYYGIRVAMEG